MLTLTLTLTININANSGHYVSLRNYAERRWYRRLASAIEFFVFVHCRNNSLQAIITAAEQIVTAYILFRIFIVIFDYFILL